MPRNTQNHESLMLSSSSTRMLERVLELASEQGFLLEVPSLDVARGTSFGVDDSSWPEALIATATNLHLRATAITLAAHDLEKIWTSKSGIFVCQSNSGYWILSEQKALFLDAFREYNSTRKFRKFLQTQASISGVFLQSELSLQPLQRVRLRSGKLWSRVFALLRMERKDLIALVIFAFVLGGLTLAVPITVQVLVNIVAFGAVLQPLVVLLILLSGVLIFAGILQLLETYIVELLQRRFFVRVAEDFSRRLPKVRMDIFNKHYGPELVNRFFDVVSVQKALSLLLLDGLGLALQTAVGFVLLAFYHPLLLAFDLLLVFLLVIVFLLGRGAGRLAIQESNAKYQVAAWLEDIARNPTLFRLGRAQEVAAKRTSLLTNIYLRARRQHFVRILRQIGGGLFVQAFSMILLLGVGGFLVIERQLTLGQLVAAEVVVGSVGYGFSKLGKYMEKGYDLLAALEKIGTVIDLPLESQTMVSISPHSLPLRPGQHIAIGKDFHEQGRQLLQQVLGLNSEEEGYKYAMPRQDIYMLHYPELIEGTILDNLRIVAPSMSLTEIYQCIEAAQLKATLQALPTGIQTKLTAHQGVPLSPAEKRRLMIARMLAAAPKVVLIEEGLDDLGLSSLAKHTLLKNILSESVPWSALIISKDPDVLAMCSSTLRFVQGEWQLQ